MRELGVSDLWRFSDADFCPCDVTDFLAEGFTEIGVDGTDIEARLAGRCIKCGVEGSTRWLTLGRVVGAADREFIWPIGLQSRTCRHRLRSTRSNSALSAG